MNLRQEKIPKIQAVKKRTFMYLDDLEKLFRLTQNECKLCNTCDECKLCNTCACTVKSLDNWSQKDIDRIISQIKKVLKENGFLHES